MLQLKAFPWRAARALCLASAAVVASLASASPSPAAADPSTTELVVEGQIDVPTTALTFGGTLRCGLASIPVDGSEWVITGVVPGRSFELTAEAGSWAADFDVNFYSVSSCVGQTAVAPLAGHRNFAGDEASVVPPGAVIAVVVMGSGNPGSEFTYREFTPVEPTITHYQNRRPTVIAVIEPNFSGFSPYHFDFLGHSHPWNNDAEPANDIDFSADPATYIPGYPTQDVTPLSLTIPTDPNTDATTIAGGPDADEWASMQPSRSASPHMYRFPGTKIIGAAKFATDTEPADLRGSTYPDEEASSKSTPPSGTHLEAHGTKGASVSAGNSYGTCPECVLVVLNGDTNLAQRWAAAQPWIDVVTNSYGFAQQLPDPRIDHEVAGRAVQSGQSWVWSGGNGYGNGSVTPSLTYPSNEKGPDWIVTVGGVGRSENSNGSGFPADVVSYAEQYPSAGAFTVTGKSAHSGTSNASPVTAGTLAHIIQLGRDLLQDSTPGHALGVVGSGTPVACGPNSCPLGDGVFTRKEALASLFANVQQAPERMFLPNAQAAANGVEALTPSGPQYLRQGHGVVHGQMSTTRFAAEQRRMIEYLIGVTPAKDRQPGEQSFMFADSRCRQVLHGDLDGTWVEGYYKKGAAAPAWNPATDQPAIALNAACAAAAADGTDVSGA